MTGGCWGRWSMTFAAPSMVMVSRLSVITSISLRVTQEKRSRQPISAAVMTTPRMQLSEHT